MSDPLPYPAPLAAVEDSPAGDAEQSAWNHRHMAVSARRSVKTYTLTSEEAQERDPALVELYGGLRRAYEVEAQSHDLAAAAYERHAARLRGEDVPGLDPALRDVPAASYVPTGADAVTGGPNLSAPHGRRA